MTDPTPDPTSTPLTQVQANPESATTKREGCVCDCGDCPCRPGAGEHVHAKDNEEGQ